MVNYGKVKGTNMKGETETLIENNISVTYAEEPVKTLKAYITQGKYYILLYQH